jgi:predicted secreted protein
MKQIISLSVFIILILNLITIHAQDSEVRIINIKDFQGEGSYLPLKSGQKFIIELEGNPTTGYSWFLEDVEKLNKELINPLNLNERNSADYYSKTQQNENNPSESEMKVLGGGGIYHFKFQAHHTNNGSEVLNFVYKRPWTQENEVRKSINVKVVNPNHLNDL